MQRNGTVRIVMAILVLLLFGVYTYVHVADGPFSMELDQFENKENKAPVEDTSDNSSHETPAPEGESEIETEPTPPPTVDPNSPEGRAAALGLPKPPDIDITSWEFLLANPDHSIEEYEPPLAHYKTAGMPDNIKSNQWGDGLRFDERIFDAMTEFITAAGDEGLNVYLSSGYRSYNDQVANFNRKLNEGMTPDVAKKIVAVPGTSEHQTGLACDITDRYYERKDSSLENTELYKWMYAHCQDYGFILRYPKDKEDITQIIYEPWHFRYVGKEAATYIMENNLCFEEFYALYVDESQGA